MTVVVVLVLGALLVSWTAPRLLDRMLRDHAEPQAILVTWLALVVGTSVSLVTAAVLVLLPGHGPAQRVISLVHHCWTALRTGSAPRIEELVGLLGILFAVVAAVRCGIGVVREARHRRNLHHRHLGLLRILDHRSSERYPTLWLNLPEAFAYSVAGSPSLVVASEGLRKHLPDSAVAAVLDHERAHLRGRHHLLVSLAEALALSLGWLPLMHQSPRFVRTAVELAADSAAARLHGCRAVRSALLGMSAHVTPRFALSMARECTELRLSVLSADRPERGPIARTVQSVLAGATAIALPAAASAALLTVATVTSCPVLG